MLVFKIIACIVFGLIGFFAFLNHSYLKELKEKATKEEKKALERIENIAIFLPIIIMCFIIIQ